MADAYSCPYSDALKYSPYFPKYSTKRLKKLSWLIVSASHTRQHCLRARVTATFIRLWSLKKPTCKACNPISDNTSSAVSFLYEKYYQSRPYASQENIWFPFRITSFFELDRTIEMIIASFSRPWNPSTVEISTFFRLSSLLLIILR